MASILIVDDSLACRNATAALLRAEGHQVNAADNAWPVVINPAAFTHYSYALREAVVIARDAGVKVVEVHLTNPAAREAFRQTSVIAGVASGTIAGFGLDSYRLALQAVAR